MPLKIKGLDTIRLMLTTDEDAASAILTTSWARAHHVHLLLCVINLSEGSVLQ